MPSDAVGTTRGIHLPSPLIGHPIGVRGALVALPITQIANMQIARPQRINHGGTPDTSGFAEGPKIRIFQSTRSTGGPPRQPKFTCRVPSAVEPVSVPL